MEKPKLIFTRYLYAIDEVMLTLLVSLLNKSEKSLFWAYELYYSGCEKEVFNLLWKIYFDFYYTLNPSFYDYFAKKHKEWNKLPRGIERDKIINMIISNLLIRPHNFDIFLLKQIPKNFDIDLEIPIQNQNTKESIPVTIIDEWLNTNNYLNIAEYVLHQCKENQLDQLLEHIIYYFKFKNSKIEHKVKKNINIIKVESRTLILAYIMLQFSILNGLTMGKKLYIIVEENEVTPFETVYSDYDSSFYPYKILPKVCLYSIDEDNYLSLFKLTRNNSSINIRDAYINHWEYYASYSPVWRERINKHKGTINHETRKIDFPDDDSFEEFYDAFNYETDEQKAETQNKSIQPILNKRTWAHYYEENKKNGLFIPDPEYLEELTTVEY